MEPTEFKLKAIKFNVENIETGEIESLDFPKETYMLDTYQEWDLDTGELVKTAYIAESEELMIRLAFQERKIGATVAVSNTGERTFRYYNQGYETSRYIDMLYILHNETPAVLEEAVKRQNVTKLGEIQTLNNRENIVPAIIVFMGL